MGIKQVLSTPRSPWQRAYIERVIGTIRRECLDHVIVFNERSLHQHLQAFTTYYHRSRTHLGLHKDTPDLDQCKRATLEKSLPFPRLAVFTIGTNVELPKSKASAGPGRRYLLVRHHCQRCPRRSHTS